MEANRNTVPQFLLAQKLGLFFSRMEEIALYWKKTPRTTFISKKEKQAKGM